MGRKPGKKCKKDVPVEEPKIKRAKKMAEDLNAEELRALLAAKLGNNPISNSGHEFVEIDPFLNVEVPDDLEQSEQRDSDDAGSEQGLIWQNGEDGQQDIEELNSSQASVVGFPMPLIIKKESAGIEVSVLEPKESGGLPEQDPVEQDQSAVATPPASGHGKKPLDEPRVPPAEEEVEDEIAGLKIKMEHKKTIIKDLKALNSKLTQENLEKDQLIFRLNKENFDLKDSKNIPRARFTTSPDINVTVEELEDFHGRTDTTGKFVGMLLVKLVGIAKLLTISVTGQPCRRFSKLRNADGTLAFPPKEKLDPKIYEFVADKVAERAAIKWGVENVKLIRAESKGEKIREAICWKINNLVKAEKSRLAREALEAGPSGVRQPEPGLEPET